MPGDEHAPWEEGSARKAAAKAQPASAVQKPYKPPRVDDLPDIYKPDDSGFLAHGGATVSRPANTPRTLDAKGKTALMVLGGAVGLGLIGVVLSFLMFTAEAGAIRFVYAAVAGLVALAAGAVLLIELPRVNAYRAGSFMPGILVYGTRDQFLRVAGPVGVSTVQSMQAQGSGRGVLSLVFDRAAHAASPPELVALHCDRGAGPELVGVNWDAVRELRRGDVVWFTMLSPARLLMYHKLIPFAPRVLTDSGTRDEVFRALKVGSSMFKDHAVAKNVGTSKILHTDRDGKIATKELVPEPVPAPLEGLALSEPGSMLGSDDQPAQESISRDTERIPRPPSMNKGPASPSRDSNIPTGSGDSDY